MEALTPVFGFSVWGLGFRVQDPKLVFGVSKSGSWYPCFKVTDGVWCIVHGVGLEPCSLSTTRMNHPSKNGEGRETAKELTAKAPRAKALRRPKGLMLEVR